MFSYDDRIDHNSQYCLRSRRPPQPGESWKRRLHHLWIDAAGHLLHLVNYSSGGSINSRFDYTYDATGRRTAVTNLNGTWNYGYDANGQLTSVSLLNGGTVQYSYDAAGNRATMVSGGATTGYNVNNLDQYTSVGGGAYGYDADGNMTSAGASTYSYDDENRLTAVSGPTGSWTYQYDALGNRVAQTSGSTTTQFLIDPTGMGSVVAEFGGSGNLVNHFAYGLGLTSSLPASGSAQFYQFDGSSDTVAVTGTGGAVLNTYRYLPFGEKVVTGSIPNPFTYAGQFGVSDDGDGLYYMRARYYDPTIGRFISEDPLQFGGGINRYAYVRNNPISRIDPMGLCDDKKCADALAAANKNSGAVDRANAAWGTIQAAADANSIDPAMLAAIGVLETGFKEVFHSNSQFLSPVTVVCRSQRMAT